MSGHCAAAWLVEHALRSPQAPCLGTPSGWLNYGELDDHVRRMAGFLYAIGVRRGDFVIVSLPNVPAAVVASLAVQSLGACSVETNPDWDRNSNTRIANKTGARIAILHGRNAANWGGVTQAFVRCVVVYPEHPPATLWTLLKPCPLTWMSTDGLIQDEGILVPPPPAAVDPDAPALVLYTSGSSGDPRGVVQTHRNVSANTRSICSYLGLTAEDRVMSVLPLYYSYGKSLLQTHLMAGGSVFFDHRFIYPHLVIDAMNQQHCTGFAGVPATFELLRRQFGVRSLKVPGLRYVTQAGGAMQPETVKWARSAFDPAALYVMYGQTEATARLSYLDPADAVAKEGSIGRGLAGVDLRIVADDAGSMPPGSIGQLVARGENVTRGYLGDDEATQEIIRDGWLWTGDLGYMDDDGFIFITGRSTELMKIRGYRVSPTEIEHCLCRHPEVLEAAVVSIPSDIEGEIAAAFVVTSPGKILAEEALRKFCRERLPIYKVPRFIRFESTLPRTGSGKICKSELKERAVRQ